MLIGLKITVKTDKRFTRKVTDIEKTKIWFLNKK